MHIQQIQNEILNHQISWEEVELRLKEDEESKEDIETNDIMMENDGTLRINGIPGYRFTENSETQVYSRFLPCGAEYLKKCPPVLKALNLNHWISKKNNKTYFVRTRETASGRSIRAILTERYAQYDNLTVFAEIVKQFRDFIPVGMTLTDTCFHLRLVQPNGIDISIRNVGDMVHGGMLICNSETGMGSLRLAVIAYRLKCKNGLVSPEETALHAKVHVGNNGDISSFFSQAVSEAREHANVLLDSLRSAGYEGFASDYGSELVNYLGKRFKWPKIFVEEVQKNVLGEDSTKFGLIQAITSAARGLPPEDRLRYERHAGNILMFSITSLSELARVERQLET